MTTFRCTAKLLKAIKAKPVAEPVPASNPLGEWTANLIRVSRIQLVLAVSEPTRLGVVIDAAPYASIPERFGQALFKTLLHLKIPAELAAAEAESMRGMQLAASNSRSVLATVNQFAVLVERHVRHGDATSADELTRRLSEVLVIKPKGIDFPADRAREAFGLLPWDRRRRLAAWLPPGTVLH